MASKHCISEPYECDVTCSKLIKARFSGRLMCASCGQAQQALLAGQWCCYEPHRLMVDVVIQFPQPSKKRSFCRVDLGPLI